MNRFKRRLPIALLFLSGLPLLGRADPAPTGTAPAADAAASSAPAAAVVAQASTTAPAPAPTVTAQADTGAAAPVVAAAGASTALSTVSVIGQRETRQVQRVNKQQIQDEPAGTSPLKMLENLPGVHFASDDPLGTDEWSSRITVRGFDHTQMGYTIDGVPMGNNDFHTGDGLSPTRVWIGENLKELELAQGAGALSTASTSNEGGTVELITDDPNAKFGLRANETYGSYRFNRSYLRLDTGDIAGFKAYVSGAYVDAPKWKGSDSQTQRQLNGKFTYSWNWGTLTGIADSTYRIEQPYLDLSLQTLGRCGYYFDYLEPNWQEAVDIAAQSNNPNAQYPGCIKTPDDTYFAGNEIRHDQLESLKGEFFLADNLTLTTQAYYHHDRSQGHWYAPLDDLPYTPDPATEAPIALRLSHYLMEREGLISSLAYDAGPNHLEGGWWFEHSDYAVARTFQPIPGGTANPNAGPIGQNLFYETYYNTLFAQRFVTLTSQWYLRDTLTLLDQRLKIDVGFKGHDVTTDAATQTTGLSSPTTVPRAGGALTAQSYFLPQVGVNYVIGGGFETFASYSMNQNAFEPGTSGPWSSDQAGFNALQPTLRPERSATTELGARYATQQLQASLAVYNVVFSNRLLVIVPCNGATSCPNQTANVGRVDSRGAEGTLIWKPVKGVEWFNSLTYNDATYRNNYIDSSSGYPNGVVPVQGKKVVDAPENLFATNISYRFGGYKFGEGGYDAGQFRVNLGTKYTGGRYYTYVNDQRISGFWLTDAGLSWEHRDVGPLKDLKLGVTVSNLLDVKYIGTIDSNGFATNDPNGSFATLLVGSPRQIFATLDGRF